MALKWYGEAYASDVERHIEQRLDIAAIHLVNAIKKKISIPGTASAIRGFSYWYGGERFNVKKRGRVYGAVVSLPGEPPRKQTGRLRASITWERGERRGVRRVGSNVEYARYLEVELDRPYLRSSLIEEGPKLAKIIGAPMRGAFEGDWIGD